MWVALTKGVILAADALQQLTATDMIQAWRNCHTYLPSPQFNHIRNSFLTVATLSEDYRQKAMDNHRPSACHPLDEFHIQFDFIAEPCPVHAQLSYALRVHRR